MEEAKTIKGAISGGEEHPNHRGKKMPDIKTRDKEIVPGKTNTGGASSITDEKGKRCLSPKKSFCFSFETRLSRC